MSILLSNRFAPARAWAKLTTGLLIATIGGFAAASPLSLDKSLSTRPATEGEKSLYAKQADARTQRFIQNVGQWDSKGRFGAFNRSMAFWVTDTGVVMDLFRDGSEYGEKIRKGHVIGMDFVGANKPILQGSRAASGAIDYVGHDAKKPLRTTSYHEVWAKGLYKGINARHYFSQGRPRYDLIVSPGADPRQIKLKFKGGAKLQVNPTEIVMGTTMGDVKNTHLYAYQTINGKNRQVPAKFVSLGQNQVGFELGSYDKTKPLTIDPLVYGSYYGGDASFDFVTGIATDLAGGAYLCGWTMSFNFPAIYGPYSFNLNGVQDAFVSKLQGDVYNHDYAAFIGGARNDQAMMIQLDPNGTVWIAGYTESTNFPGNTRRNIQYLRMTTVLPNLPNGAGNFTMSYPGKGTTAPIPWNATPAQVQTALEAILGAGNAIVTLATGGPNVGTIGTEYKISLANSLPLMLSVNSTRLRGFYQVTKENFNFQRAQIFGYATAANAGQFAIQYSYVINGNQIVTAQTDPINFNASAAAVQAALRAMPAAPGDPGSNPLPLVRVVSTDQNGTANITTDPYLVYFDSPQPFVLSAIPVPNTGFNGTFAIQATQIHTIDFDHGASTPVGGTFTVQYGNDDQGFVDSDPISAVGTTLQVRNGLNTIPALANNVVVLAQNPNPGNARLPLSPLDAIWVGNLAGPDLNELRIASNAGVLPQPIYTTIGTNDIFVTRFQQSATTALNPLPTKTFMIGSDRNNDLAGFRIVPDEDPTPGQTVRLLVAGMSDFSSLVPEVTKNSPLNVAGFVMAFDFTENGNSNPLVGFNIDTSVGQYVRAQAGTNIAGLDVDAEGNFYLTGIVVGGETVDTAANPSVFQTTPVDPDGALRDGRLLRLQDIYARKYNAAGNLVYSVLIGGNGNESTAIGQGTIDGPNSVPSGIAVDAQGSAYVTGISRSFNFPRTRGVFGEIFTAGAVVVVSKLNLDGSDLVYSTNLRTGNAVWPIGIGVDGRGVAHVSGQVSAITDFPDQGDPANPPAANAHIAIGNIPVTADALKAAYSAAPPPAPASDDGFLVSLNPTATGIVFGSYFGGTLDDYVMSPYIDKSGDVWIFGQTETHSDFEAPPGTIVAIDTRLPDSHTTSLAFRPNPDPAGGLGGTFFRKSYGRENVGGPAWGSFDGTGFLVTFSRRDGFMLRIRIGLPTISSVTFNPGTIAGGFSTSVTGTVTLNAPAPSGGVDVVLDLNNLTAASFGANTPVSQQTIFIAQGQTAANFTVFTRPVTGNQTVDVKATLEGLFRIGRFNVVPWLTTLTTSPTSVVGGNVLSGRVRLFQPAPAGGVTVQMTSNKPELVSFGNVTVPAGFDTVTFDIATEGVVNATPVTITATLLGTGKSQNITITQASLFTLTFNPPRVTGGATATGTLNLNGETGPTPFTVNLSIQGNPAGYTFNPPSLTFQPGERTKSFQLTTPVETNDVSRTIVATRAAQNGYALSSVQGTLAIDGSALFAFTIAPTTVDGGGTSEGTVTISKPAQTGGAVVSLSKNPNDGGVTIPATVIVPEGQTTTKFTIQTAASVTDKAYTITATRGGVSIPQTLNVKKLGFTLTATPTTFAGGTASTGKITLTGNAPAGGVLVNLSSSNPAVASVPATVTVPAGQNQVTFPITTVIVGTDATVTITATIAGQSDDVQLSVTAAQLASIKFEPDSVVGNKTTRCTVTFSGPVSSSGVNIKIATSNGLIARMPPQVFLAGGKTFVSFTIATRRVSTNQTVQVTATAPNGAIATGTLRIRAR